MLLFVSCSNENHSVDDNRNGSGELMLGKIIFAGVSNNAQSRSLKAASSTSIPRTNWSNINQVQLFLYELSGTNVGKIAFSYIIQPTEDGQEFTWSNVPTGSYRLALVANVNSASDPIATSVNGTPVAFNAYNVVDRLINTQVAIDLKGTTLPSNHTFEAGKSGYLPSSEIFTAYEDITITEGQKTVVSNMQLKREVSLMRLRVDRSQSYLDDVEFDHALAAIFVHRLPVGFSLPTTVANFTGGGSSASNIDRIMIAKTGANTFKDAHPSSATHTNPETILNGSISLWQEFCVLPNQIHGQGVPVNDTDADSGRKYFVVLSGMVPAGYEYADGTVAEEEENPVYWSATINKVFSENIIREVNITISSKGYPENPGEPKPEGGLDISVDAPVEWEAIYSVDVEV